MKISKEEMLNYNNKKMNIVNEIFEKNKINVINEAEKSFEKYNNEFLRSGMKGNFFWIDLREYLLNYKVLEKYDIESFSVLEAEINDEILRKYKNMLEDKGYIVRIGYHTIEIFNSKKQKVLYDIKNFFLDRPALNLIIIAVFVASIIIIYYKSKY